MTTSPHPDPKAEPARTGPSTALTALPPRDASVLVRTVRDRLRLAIILTEIPPGARLNQVQVAERLGVSRMPVRAAAADLVAEGLLDNLPTGGYAVRALSESDIRCAYEVREALEAQAARDVASSAPEADIDSLFEILERHAALGGVNDTAELLALDRAFHGMILDATGNPYFGRAMIPLWSVVERAMVGMLRDVPDMFDRAWRQHRGIAEALRAGDADAAERLTREHLGHAAEALLAVHHAGDETSG